MKIILKTLIFLLIPYLLSGQQSPVTSQYILNPLIINPSYAGERGALNIAAFYRRQWVGIKGAPETITMAIDAPLFHSKLGVGLIIIDDKLGVSNEKLIGTNYAYKIKMADGTLSFGLGAGLRTTNTRWSELVALEPGDEQFLADSRVFVLPSFNFGTYFTYKSYFAAISIPRLLEYSFDPGRNGYTSVFNPDHYNYLLNTGYVFTLSQKLKLLSSTLITYSAGEKLLYDLNAHLIVHDRLWCGASYMNNRSLSGLIQVAINYQFKVSYSYDFDIGKLGPYSAGSHEIMLRYEFRYKLDAINPLVF